MNLIPSGVIQVSLWFQMLFWFWLYDVDIHFNRDMEPTFYGGGFLLFSFAYIENISIGYFTNRILLQYIVFIMAATYLYNNKYEFKKAVCLGFLTVFLNSFYWEFFYHVYEFQIWLPYSLGFEWWYIRLPQWIRTLPAYWFTRKLHIKDTKPLMLGLIISFFLTLYRFQYNGAQLWLQPLHRTICLIMLIITIYNAEQRQTLK